MTDSHPQGDYLGVVIGGSLSRGVEVRLDAKAPVEDMALGQHVVIQGQSNRFFGVITEITLESSDDTIKANPPDLSNPLVARVVSSTAVYATLRVLPMLTLEGELALVEGPKPAKTVPPHFSAAYLASEEDVQMVFGAEDQRHFWVGTPLDMETRVCLDLEELVKRSNGVFGKSGTGKSFLTRILLAGIVQKRVATNLVFDMHSEYGWQGTSESGYAAKGLKQLFGSRVSVFTLDEQSSRRRGLSPDLVARIGFDEIEPEDVAILAPVLNITDLGVQACYSLERFLGGSWVSAFLAHDDLPSLAVEINANQNTLDALRNRLTGLRRLGFMVERADASTGAVQRVLEHLMDGRHVVLEFGKHGDDLTAYLLVANLITRRIHAEYRRRTEEAQATDGKEPDPLVITIEEAHRFLNPGVAGQTIFGTIAREMRKYRVTLLVVDQRPSGIDPEVLSQVGTRITCQLDNDRDVDAVLAGAPGARELRTVLARLESQQQSLMFGHALPMPVVVRTRTYDDEFFREVTTPGHGVAPGGGSPDKRDLFG